MTGAVLFMGATPLTVTVSPTSASGSQPGGGLATTNSVTLFPVGGSGGYVYGWGRLSGSTAISADEVLSSVPSTTFSGVVSSGGTEEAVFRGFVTDSLGDTASVDLTVTLTG